jgi:hypothetical protein
MPHQYDPKDPFSYGEGHTIKEMIAIDKPTTVASENTDSFINQQNQIGVSGGINQLPANRGSLASFLPDAQKLYDTLYTKTPEQQEREDRINTGMMMLNFFTKMGAESSKPGATAFGAANIAGADTASMYIKQVNAERARKDAEKKSVIGLASQLKTSADAKDIAELRLKNVKPSKPDQYKILNANEVVKALKLPMTNPRTNKFYKDGDVIDLTPSEFALVPRGNLTSFKKETKEKLEPFGVVNVAKFKAEYPNIQISPNGNVLLKPSDAIGISQSGLITEKLGEQVGGMSKTQFDGLDKLQGNLAPSIKAFKELQRAYDNIKGFFKDQSAINDYGLAVGFAKILDPTSVARESEVQSVATAGSITQSMKAQIINALMGTGKLSAAMRQQIYNSTIQIYSNKIKRFQPELDAYKKNAEGIVEGGFSYVAPGFVLEKSDDVLSQKVAVVETADEPTKVIINNAGLKRFTVTGLKDLIANAGVFQLTDDDLQLIEKELDSR